MKQNLNIKAFIISENNNYTNIKINIHDIGLKSVHISSLHLDRKNLSDFRHKLINAFSEVPDLFIFDIELPVIISKQVIRRINQYIPRKIPAVILAKQQENESIQNAKNDAIKLLINTSENLKEQQRLKESVTNFWYSINCSEC